MKGKIIGICLTIGKWVTYKMQPPGEGRSNKRTFFFFNLLWELVISLFWEEVLLLLWGLVGGMGRYEFGRCSVYNHKWSSTPNAYHGTSTDTFASKCRS